MILVIMRSAPRTGRRAHLRARGLQALLDETRLLFHRGAVAAREIHGQGEMSAGRRGVLRDLARLGPRSVPQLARARPVSRQLIQSLVTPLVAEGYAELAGNPAHRRSPLVRLTAQGRRLVASMAEREEALVSRLPIGVSERDLLRASEVLQAVREAFESEAWQQLVDEADAPRRRRRARA